MVARRILYSIIFGAIAATQPAQARAATEAVRPVRIRAAPLAEALRELTRQTGTELLYDKRIATGARSSGVRGTMLPEQALGRLLAGTGVGYRRTAEGVFILIAQPQAPAVGPEAEPAIPEILVVGVRTQNADIRRTRNDIQPYVVSARADIENAHRDNLGDFFQSRISANAQPFEPAQNLVAGLGSVNSQIDLRGLGTLRTLVLVDGRRLPSLPTPQFDFGQADINAVPLSAIDRIETLTGTAGGIYGPGAIGGVTNIILRRDYRGADLHLVSGISSRGDARRLGIEGRIGFTPDGGRTDVMFFGARTTIQPLRAGDVDYAARARRHRFEHNPGDYIASPPVSNAIGVFSQSGDLTLDPAFGGGSLGSAVTYLPVGLSGPIADHVPLLASNAGHLVFDLPEDQSGTRRYLLSNPTVSSAILNVRHRFTSRLEGFIDILYFRDDGHFEGQGEAFVLPVGANAPNNPFQQPVILTFPNLGLGADLRTVLDSRRMTAGLLADLGSWKGSADLTLGQVKSLEHADASAGSSLLRSALSSGAPGPDGLPIVDPLGDWTRLALATATLVERTQIRLGQVNRFGTGSVRFAGPLARLAGGPLNLTVLAEERREASPAQFADFTGDRFNLHLTLPIRRQAVRSAYAELRAPIVPAHWAAPLRGLEFQLAARYDRVRTTVPVDATPPQPTNGDLTSITNSGVTYTAGARLFPLRALMFRGSVATGELPPTIEQLATNQFTYAPGQLLGPGDPQRGNQPLGTEGMVLVHQRGSHDLKAEDATTLSVGTVLNPDGGALPRLSLDYSRISVRREVSFVTTGVAAVLANEAQFAARIVRAPLTDEDRERGFTAGRILSIDLSAFNGGRTAVETLDGQLEWTRRIGPRGALRFYGNATWYPSFKNKATPDSPWRSRLGYFDTLVRLRGNIGVEWTRGPLMIGLNAQYFGHYRPTYFDQSGFPNNPRIIANQGSNRIPSQAYVDLSVRRRFRISERAGIKSLDVSFGIEDLFDKRPPLVAQDRLPGYSYYGDPRRRRFELVLSGGF